MSSKSVDIISKLINTIDSTLNNNKMAEQVQEEKKGDESSALLEERAKLELQPPSPDGTPKVVLGTMEFGRRLDYEQSVKVSELFLAEDFVEIDTAYVYQGGKSETYIGDMFEKTLKDKNVLLQTKVNPNYKNGDVTGTNILSHLHILFT